MSPATSTSTARNTPTHVGKTGRHGAHVRLYRKHPHACGEDGRRHYYCVAPKETPPRMWGRPVSLHPIKSLDGNTPTHVGKTGHNPEKRLLRGKHPHACGEDRRHICAEVTSEETPPRMWGRRIARVTQLLITRNTPTHVGKTAPRRTRLTTTGKHPHACGEDSLTPMSRTPTSETPPRMWGRQSGNDNHASQPGNTPTHVGKTWRPT